MEPKTSEPAAADGSAAHDPMDGSNGKAPARQRRSLREIAGEEIELGKTMPPPDKGAMYADARWVQEHWSELVERYPGTDVAVVDGKVQAASNDPEMQLEVARRLRIHPHRAIVVYVHDPNDPQR